MTDEQKTALAACNMRELRNLADKTIIGTIRGWINGTLAIVTTAGFVCLRATINGPLAVTAFDPAEFGDQEPERLIKMLQVVGIMPL